jgi:RNA polymerase sigma factor (sigma-70 family)
VRGADATAGAGAAAALAAQGRAQLRAPAPPRKGAPRGAREAVARAPAAPEAPDAFAERLEAEQRLTLALAGLAEPFRSTLMLRYYEDLEPSEIAARLRLPGGTVRWRLMRGLALLRERLDESHGGDRRAWSLALVPLARLDGAAGLGP